jgi:hypothetical protein
MLPSIGYTIEHNGGIMSFFSRFDGERAIKELREASVTVLPQVCRTYRAGILTVLRELLTEKAAPTSGPRNVRQDYEFVCAPGKVSILNMLRMDWNQVFADCLLGCSDNPIPAGFHFDTQDVHHYGATDVGIDWHRDGPQYRQVTALIVLEGDGDFMVARDHEGLGAQRIEAVPGDMILLAMSGFAGQKELLYHGIFRVTTTRTTMMFRTRY